MIRPSKADRPARRTRLRPTVDRLEGRALMATAGVLDPSFGAGTGSAAFPITSQSNVITGLGGLGLVQVESDGSIVASAPSDVNGVSSIGVLRLNADGTRDTAFGTNGVAFIALPPGPGNGFSIGQLLVQPGTGNVIVVASTGDTVVAELKPDGTPNAAFGTNGVLTLTANSLQTAFGFAANLADEAALEPDGKLVLLGFHGITIPNTDLGTSEVAVARLNLDGSFDTSFAGQGLELVSSIPPADFTKTSPTQGGGYTQTADEGDNSLAIQPNGQIVIGTSYLDRDLTDRPVASDALIRLNLDGSVDPSLGQAGIRAFDASANSNEGGENSSILIARPDGSFVVGGVTSAGLINADGSAGGVTTIVPNGGAHNLTALPGGGFAVLGGNGAVVRYNANLTPDGSFGDAGVSAATAFIIPPGSGKASIQFLSLADGPDGKLVLVGDNPTYSYFGLPNAPTFNVVARLTATGTKATQGDFIGDGISDPAIYLPQYGAFAIADSSGRTIGQTVPFGIPGPGQTIPAPGDYYGTGQDDIAAYLPTFGAYAIKDPTGQTAGIDIPFGIAGAGQTIPAPGDYYGTGQDDIAVYLTALGVFAIQDPTGKTPGEEVQFGQAGAGNSIPVPGDYYGTGRDDIAVYLPQSAVWAIQDPSGNTNGELIPFGMPGIGNSIPVPGDYDGSGKTELAVYIPSAAAIIYRPADGGADVTIPFGTPGIGNTLPAPGDYDGSGKTEVAAYLPSLGIIRVPASERWRRRLRFDRRGGPRTDDPGDDGGALAVPGN